MDLDSCLSSLAPALAERYQLQSPVPGDAIAVKHGDRSDGRSEILAICRSVGLQALDKRLGKEVHLDIVPKHHRFVPAFRREYAALRRLDHPSVVKAYDFFEDEHCAVLATEYIGCESLDQRIRRARLGLEGAMLMLLELAEVLAHARRCGVAHPDLRPSRVFVKESSSSKRLQVAVRGFEFAPDGGWGFGGDDAREYLSHVLYAPSQQHAQNVETYSWGVIAFEAIADVRPFDSDYSFDVATMHEVAPAPELAALGAGPQWLSDLVAACLEKRPAKRPTLETVVECLQKQKSPARTNESAMLRVERDLSIYNEFVTHVRAKNASRFGAPPTERGLRRLLKFCGRD